MSNEIDEPDLELLPNETDFFVQELLSFNEFWDRLLLVYKPLEKAVLAFGLIGNLLALITFVRSKKMYTPSFVYHRVLVAADLIFCCNFFTYLAIDRWLSVECRQYVYRYWFGAFFSGTLNPAITSICGYMIDYSTLVIALDRFLALISATGFQRWNRLTVALCVTLFITFLSSAVHSWSFFLEKTVLSFYLGKSKDMLIGRPCWNDSVVYHWTKREEMSGAYQAALSIREIYSRSIRMIYPVALSLLTLGVIAGIIRRQRRRENARRGRRMRLNGSWEYEGLELASCAADRYRDAGISLDRSNGIRKRKRCERALFLMMTAVLVLAFIQVGASEARRLLQLIQPPAEILRQKVADSSLPLEDRLWYFRFVLYGHQASKIFANACTVIERSLICVLYMIMNRLFRQELFSLLSVCFCPGRWGREFRSRIDSNPRPAAIENLRCGGVEAIAAVHNQHETVTCPRRDVSMNLWR